MGGDERPQVISRQRRSARWDGFSLIEVMTAVAIMSVVIGMAVPSIIEWRSHYEAKKAARTLADIFHKARAEAMRTGNQQVVFFGNPGLTDADGNDVEVAGAWVPVLVLDEDNPGNANCAIEGGETSAYIRPVADLSWGVTQASGIAPGDSGGAPFNPNPSWDGGTFTKPDASKANWVLFRGDGIPLAFEGTATDCGTIGATGSGGGGLYMTDGKHDFAVVLSPLGGVRLHLWSGGSWSN